MLIQPHGLWSPGHPVHHMQQARLPGCCPVGHPMEPFKAPAETTFNCDRCKKEIRTGSQLYGCRQCNYDECRWCFAEATPAPLAAGDAVKLQGSVESAHLNGSPDKAAPMQRLAPGVAVKFHGLVESTHLNGLSGVCDSWRGHQGSWCVRLANGELILAKPENLDAQVSPCSAAASSYLPPFSTPVQAQGLLLPGGAPLQVLSLAGAPPPHLPLFPGGAPLQVAPLPAAAPSKESRCLVAASSSAASPFPAAAPGQVPLHPDAPASSPGGKLHIGGLARVGKHTFRVTSSLGQGSFSSVWAAVRIDAEGCDPDSLYVAIKETVCQHAMEIQDAENEGKILEQIAGTSSRIPGLIAIETSANAAGTKSVRMAMSKVPGDSVGAFLNKWKEKHGGYFHVPTADPHAVESQLSEAFIWGRELILQMLPVFEAVSPIALHRDVNTHNLLVNTESGDLCAPEFGLIDFGLAIEMNNWPSQSLQVPVVGDCRYWPASAWLIFAAGGAELAKYPPLLMEYRTQLDSHALGITALQVFVELLPNPVAGSPAVAVVPEEFWALRSAWEHYWKDATRFWEPLYLAFQKKADWTQVRQSYLLSNVHFIISEDLGRVRQALSNARNACPRDPGSHLFSARPLLAALLELISQAGTGLPGEVPPGSLRFGSWQGVRSILATDAANGPARQLSSSDASTTEPNGGGTTTTPSMTSQNLALRCPSGHELISYVRDTPGENSCNGCGRSGIVPPESIYRCKPCDFDLCRRCYEAPKAFVGASTTVSVRCQIPAPSVQLHSSQVHRATSQSRLVYVG